MSTNKILKAYLLEFETKDPEAKIASPYTEIALDLITEGDSDSFSEYVDIVSTAIQNIHISDSPRFIVLSILRIIFIETGLMLSKITGNPFWVDWRLVRPHKPENVDAILANIHNLYEKGEVIHATDDDTD